MRASRRGARCVERPLAARLASWQPLLLTREHEVAAFGDVGCCSQYAHMASVPTEYSIRAGVTGEIR